MTVSTSILPLHDHHGIGAVSTDHDDTGVTMVTVDMAEDGVVHPLTAYPLD